MITFDAQKRDKRNRIMKKSFILSIMAVTMTTTVCMAQKAWRITGTATGLPTATTIYFNKAVDGDLSPIDSMKLDDTTFRFSGTRRSCRLTTAPCEAPPTTISIRT